MTEEKFQQILSLQVPDEEKRARADYVIETDRGMESSMAQVQKIVDTLHQEHMKGRSHARGRT